MKQGRIADELALEARRLIAMGEAMLSKAIALGAKDPQLNLPELRYSQEIDDREIAPASRAQRLYSGRRIRDKIFPPDLFGEPSWDILLDLYMATARGSKLPVSAVCIGSQVPSTTALRYITILEEHGLIQRSDDPVDHRRYLLRLSRAGMEAMDTFFELTAKPAKGRKFARGSLRLASFVEK